MPEQVPNTSPQPDADALKLLTGYHTEPELAGRVARLVAHKGKLLIGYYSQHGTYRPVENDMPYGVKVQEAGLVFKSVKSREVALTAVAPDHFLGNGDRFTFTRDGEGRVTGMPQNGGRIRNFRFERL